MKRLLIKETWIGILLFCCFVLVDVQAQHFDESKLGAYLDTLEKKNKLMGSVALSHQGDLIYQKSVGYKQLNDQAETADNVTQYRIGSVTKMYTATMVMQLVEEGLLTLDTKLSTYYSDLPNADGITIRNLLEHKSGLFNFTNDPQYTNWMTEPHTKEQLLEMFSNRDPEFEPGSKQMYSNTNYVLLHFIIEDVTESSYGQQLQTRIIEPLNLQATYFKSSAYPSREASSYSYQESEWTELPVTDMSVPGGAGAIISTPQDMTVFIRGLFKGELLKKSTVEKMKPENDMFGLGMMQYSFSGKTAYGHNGGIDGFQSNLTYIPQEDLALAFTSNGLNYNMNDILIGVLSVYFGQPFDIPTFDERTIELSASELTPYEGTYQTDQLPIDMSIFAEGEVLKGQATGQPSFPLTAHSRTEFSFSKAGLEIEFTDMKEGKYQTLILKQAGGEFVMSRKE
ncbi:MAG: serine hydrolase domain-containing protein [Bacteroidota bacterium]